MKNLLLTTLLVSSVAIANQPFQNNFFDQGFNNNVWSSFNQQFQQFNNEMRDLQNKSIFGAQTNRYFNDKSNSYIIEIKVDGLAKENLDINTKDNMIHIAGRVQKTAKTANSSRSSSKQFSQSYSLPLDADGDNIDAEFKDDILIVSIPKLDTPKPRTNKITIK